MIINRVEQIQINKTHYLWEYCDTICFKAKNLYNYANYLIRQEFINNGKWVRYNALDKLLKNHETYKELPAQTAQQILKLLDRSWKSFFKAIKDWNKNKSKYLGRSKLPKYKKKDGRSVTIFTNQQCKIKSGYLTFPKTKLKLKTKVEGSLREVRIIPKGTIYIIEIVYQKEINTISKQPKRIAGIDLGHVNGAYNIVKKVFPDAFAEGIEGVGLHPVRLNVA